MDQANIAIIGAGQLGSRHLQALALLDRPATIQVVDPSAESLNIAEERYRQVQSNEAPIQTEFLQDISNLAAKLDIVIIATSSNVRRKVIEQLLTISQVKYLILEKVVFQKAIDFSEMDRLFREKNVRVWVNCPRRTWPIYKDLSEVFAFKDAIQFQAVGSGWDIGTNGIHMIDLFAFLSGHSDITVTSEQLSAPLTESKRKGFYRFDGAIQGVSSKGNSFNIASYPSGNAPLQINVSNSDYSYIIQEKGMICEVLYTSSDLNWVWQKAEYPILFQSNLTHLCVQQILDHGLSDLTTYAESWQFHLPMLDVLRKHYNKLAECEGEVCPIT